MYFLQGVVIYRTRYDVSLFIILRIHIYKSSWVIPNDDDIYGRPFYFSDRTARGVDGVKLQSSMYFVPSCFSVCVRVACFSLCRPGLSRRWAIRRVIEGEILQGVNT